MAKKLGYKGLYDKAKRRVCVALRFYALHLNYLIDYASEIYLEDPVVYNTVKAALREAERVKSTMRTLCGSDKVGFLFIGREELGEIYYRLVVRIGTALSQSQEDPVAVGNWYKFISYFTEDGEDVYKKSELAVLLELLGVERDGDKMVIKRDVAEAALHYMCAQLRRHYVIHEDALPIYCSD